MFYTIPKDIISLATLEYLGFDGFAAADIWRRWTNWPSESAVKRETDDCIHGMPFIDFATGHLASKRQFDTDDQDDQLWSDCLDQCGIGAQLQMAIMDPALRKIRLTESCLYWVEDSILLRHRGLEQVQRASRDGAKHLQRTRTRPDASSADTSQPSISATMGMAPGISHDTAMSQAALAAANSPGSITLYKAIDQAHLAGMFNDAGEVVDISPLFSKDCATDFMSRESGLYFAVDRDIAEYYACYAKRRGGVNSVAIVQVAISESAIESLSDTELIRTYWPSTEWKNLVFHCRKRQKLPHPLRKFKQAKLIIGTIASKPNVVYERMHDPEQVVERMVLKNRDGRNAVQYAFNDYQGDDFFQEHAVPSIKVFPLTAVELDEWLENRR